MEITIDDKVMSDDKKNGTLPKQSSVLRGEKFVSFQRKSEWKSFLDQGGIITILRRRKLSHSAEKFCRRTLRCFRELRVSKSFMHKGGREYHNFPLKIFCLAVPKKFVEEPFCVSEKFWYRKILFIERRGGSITIFSRKFVVSQYWKTSYGNPLVFRYFREFLTQVSEIIKIFRTTEARTRTYCWRTLLS